MQIIKLWDDVPGAVSDWEIPVLEYYPAENKKGNGTVVICPGGGYCKRAAHEGEGYAEYLNSIGLDCFVLQYRVSPYRFPFPQLDGRRAIRYVRANADKYGIDPKKIAIMGSSAGGHLAESVCTYRGSLSGEGIDDLDSVDYMPNAQILCYPVTDFDSHNGSYYNLIGKDLPEDEFSSMCEELDPIKLVNSDTPPAFIWHTETDTCVKMESTLKYATVLHQNNVRTEMHIYPKGHHGLGLAPSDPFIGRWASDLAVWLKFMNYIEE